MFTVVYMMATIVAPVAQAKIAKPDWEVSSGKLTYHIRYPLKKIDGVSSQVRGKGHCEAGQCEFLVAAPVKSFESGDGNRDNHMLEVTKAAINPMVIAKIKFADKDPLDARVEVNFAGKTRVYEHIAIAISQSGQESVAKGAIPLVLSDFEVTRPSLLGMSVEDAVPVDFVLNWK